jgi:hypothetical protein
MPEDDEVRQVATQLRMLDPNGRLTAQVLRDTFDQIYDGQRTGRYSIENLAKTERTHIGTLVEINMQRRFRFADGDELDFSICGHDVDAKYSMKLGGWMIPIEAQGKICMLIHADDHLAEWSLGVVRTEFSMLNAPNRDMKRSIKSTHLDDVTWIFKKAALPENTILRLPAADRAAIAARRPGSQRVAELMRRAEGHIVNRSSIEATAQQKDSMKRVRANGGAADLLADEGYLLLSGTRVAAQRAASELGFPPPMPGTFLPIRVTDADPDTALPTTEIDGRRVRVWHPGDPVVNTRSLAKWLSKGAGADPFDDV